MRNYPGLSHKEEFGAESRRLMISENDKSIIVDIASRYKAKKVLLFGSSVRQQQADDIDLAVEGIQPEDFFRFYGDLIFQLSKIQDPHESC